MDYTRCGTSTNAETTIIGQIPRIEYGSMEGICTVAGA